MAQIELATDVIFKQPSPLRALFQRAVELGVLVGGADRTTHLFGRRINRQLPGQAADRAGPPRRGSPGAALVLPDVVRQAVRDRPTAATDRDLLNDTYHLDVGRRLDNMPKLGRADGETNQRFLDAQAELLASTVDTGRPGPLAAADGPGRQATRARPDATGRSRDPPARRRCSTPAASSLTGPHATPWLACSPATASPTPTTDSASSATTSASSALTASSSGSAAPVATASPHAASSSASCWSSSAPVSSDRSPPWPPLRADAAQHHQRLRLGRSRLPSGRRRPRPPLHHARPQDRSVNRICVTAPERV